MRSELMHEMCDGTCDSSMPVSDFHLSILNYGHQTRLGSIDGVAVLDLIADLPLNLDSATQSKG